MTYLLLTQFYIKSQQRPSISGLGQLAYTGEVSLIAVYKEYITARCVDLNDGGTNCITYNTSQEKSTLNSVQETR